MFGSTAKIFSIHWSHAALRVQAAAAIQQGNMHQNNNRYLLGDSKFQQTSAVYNTTVLSPLEQYKAQKYRTFWQEAEDTPLCP